MKPLYFVASSLSDLRDFPIDARREAGYQLRRVQQGFEPNDSKPMKTIGAGVREIRIHREGQFRVIYLANVGDASYVLHAFQKKTQRTRKQDLELARRRLQQVPGYTR